MGRRPNTVAPAATEVMVMSSEELVRMDDAQLIQFADQVLSIAIPYGTKRSTILTRVVNAAMGARDGA